MRAANTRGIMVILCLTLTACMPLSKANAENAEVSINHTVINLTVARTLTELETGLSKTSGLSANHGMLFIMPYEDRHCFNTTEMQYPIDIAFLDNKGGITDIYTASPKSQKLFCSRSKHTKFVIETRAGFFQRHQVKRSTVAEPLP